MTSSTQSHPKFKSRNHLISKQKEGEGDESCKQEECKEDDETYELKYSLGYNDDDEDEDEEVEEDEAIYNSISNNSEEETEERMRRKLTSNGTDDDRDGEETNSESNEIRAKLLYEKSIKNRIKIPDYISIY